MVVVNSEVVNIGFKFDKMTKPARIAVHAG